VIALQLSGGRTRLSQLREQLAGVSAGVLDRKGDSGALERGGDLLLADAILAGLPQPVDGPPGTS